MDARGNRSSTIALMYHAIGPNPGTGADPHYTVDADRFLAQIETCLRLGGAAISGRDWLAGRDGVIVTFDDGHETNHRIAFPALARLGATADFFVNPAQVGTPGFATWAELREMAEGGMSIQSHGLDHRHYLTELPPAQLRADLARAREEIEAHVGQPVTLLAPAGGRCPPDLDRVAREVGYTHVFNSRPGPIRSRAASSVCRFAITAQLEQRSLEAWISGGRARRIAELRYSLLAVAKRVLGDRVYERVRAGLLGAGRS